MTDQPRDPRGAALLAGPLVPLAGIVLVLVAALALREVASIVVPVVFGLFLALVAWPLVGRLERRGVRHSVAVTAAMLVVLVVVLVAVGIAAFSVAELVLQVPRYESRLREQIELLQATLADLGIVLDPAALIALIEPSQILAFLRPVASAASSGGLAVFVLVVTMIYALFGAAGLQARARQAYGEGHALIFGIEQFGIDLRRYLLVRAQLGLFAAVLAFLLLLVLGIPFPALWAFLVFAASFIPNIGTFIAVIPPTVMAFLAGGLAPAVVVVVGYTLINFGQDHFLQPVMMGSELNLSPLVVFISVLAWAWILGAAGALLAVPLTVGLVAVMEAFPGSRNVAALLRHDLEPAAATPVDPDADPFTTPSDPVDPTEPPTPAA
ncbi:MAG TPA: AI-2E family transporter [Candidatus Limnocylindrales bacterium]|nr:AI-2E family transporter [Candidatus Limnocylindrales bacterium]